MARTATVSTLDLGTAAGVMGVIDTLTSAAASGRKVRVVPAADEARNREAARAAINGGRTAARKETPVVASDKTVESKVKRAVRQEKPGSIEALVEAIKDPAEKESALAMVQRAQAKRRANGTKVVKAQQVPVDATVADTLAGATDRALTGAELAQVVGDEKAIAAFAEVAQVATAVTTGETRRCAGGPKWGLPPHDAPVATWGPPSSRTCRPCAAEYVKRTKAAKAAATPAQVDSTEPEGTVAPAEEAPAAVSPQMAELLAAYGAADEKALVKAIVLDEKRETGARITQATARAMLDSMLEARYQRIEGAGAAETAQVDGEAVDGTVAQATEHAVLAAALDAVGGEATDDGQTVLRAAAMTAAEARRAADRDRKRAERAALKAANAAKAQS